jgi:nitrogen fixation/metabolism regulation signal transduction histidine kinase
MGFNNFRLNVLIRVAGLALTITGLILLIIKTEYYATMVGMGIFIIIWLGALVNYVEKTNRDIAQFLNSIKFDDFSYTFSEKKIGASFDRLNREFNSVLGKFREIRAEKEAQYHYLKTVVQHVSIGLVSFKSDGEIQLINSAAKKLLNVIPLRHLSDITQFNEELARRIEILGNGEKDLIKIKKKNQELQLSVAATVFKLRKEEFKLVSIQNIQSELEEKEMEAWQNLIRVLTHEIMNSVTPISSLASTVDDAIVSHISDNPDPRTVEKDDLEDMHMAIQTIKRRSESLIKFVSDFRDMTRIPYPSKSLFRVKDLLDHVYQLMKPDLDKAGVEFKFMIEPDNISVNADRDQIEQVIINLMKNAIQALAEQENKKICIKGWMDALSRVHIAVEDNGPGIEKEALERIFIPFFTTKKTGSGIGLSLSRQIMRLHKGNLSVDSSTGEKTVFTLRF